MQELRDNTLQERWMEFLLQETDAVSQMFENAFQAAIEITGLPVAEVTRLRHETHLRVEALADTVGIGYRAGDEFAISSFLSGTLLDKRDSIVIPDLSKSPFARHPAATQLGIRSYIGTPLILSNKQVYGVLSLCDKRPHDLGREELVKLGVLGRWLSREIELRQLNKELANKNNRLSALSQELQRLHTQVEQGSIRDPITDLLNSRYFNKMLQTESARARRHAYPLSLLLLYPDGFQPLVRQWGMEVGHTILSSIGVLLRRHLRNIDSAARYTEEIFAILLPQTDISGAAIVGDRIRTTISTHRFTNPANQRVAMPLTASIGIAGLIPVEDDPAMGILSRSRRSLEQARNAGGNRVIVFQGNRS
ncbi:MAG: hypothetical protein CL920_15040 [Deltaproteobacteria bacterium]|nr:hypothetical protein [Deltaproteobacteria bacterium]